MKQITEQSIAFCRCGAGNLQTGSRGELGVKTPSLAVVDLVKEGCTVAFIARYRKEKTGSLDEVQVREVFIAWFPTANLETRRLEVIGGIFSQGSWTKSFWETFANARRCQSWKTFTRHTEEKKTRGMIDAEKGLEPLAEIMRTHGKRWSFPGPGSSYAWMG